MLAECELLGHVDAGGRPITDSHGVKAAAGRPQESDRPSSRSRALVKKYLPNLTLVAAASPTSKSLAAR